MRVSLILNVFLVHQIGESLRTKTAKCRAMRPERRVNKPAPKMRENGMKVQQPVPKRVLRKAMQRMDQRATVPGMGTVLETMTETVKALVKQRLAKASPLTQNPAQPQKRKAAQTVDHHCQIVLTICKSLKRCRMERFPFAKSKVSPIRMPKQLNLLRTIPCR
jgi:acyl-CoA synthetase (AMP-forming)/AMP-acid ligase II